MLHDQPGMLSSILGLMAKSGANLMTVNQSIPHARSGVGHDRGPHG